LFLYFLWCLGCFSGSVETPSSEKEAVASSSTEILQGALPPALPPDAFQDLSAEDLRYIEHNWGLLSTRRDTKLKPEETIAAMGLQPGMSIVDLGAGTGYFAFRFADVVGETGRVFATDIASGALLYMRAVIDSVSTPQSPRYSNIELVLNPIDSTGVAPQSADMVFVCSIHVFAHVGMLSKDVREDSAASAVDKISSVHGPFIENIYETLRPGGRFVYLEGSPGSHDGVSLDGPGVTELFGRHGFKFVSQHTHLRNMDMLIFERPAEPAP